MKRLVNWTRMSAIVLGICVAGSALATNGYFTHGTGTKNKGMVGAGIALPQDAIDTVNNPAAAVLVGENMQVGVAIFNPNRSYKTWGSQANGQGGAFSFGNNDIDSDSNYFPIPHFSRSWQRANDTAIAVSFYGRGGMNTDWSGGTAIFDPDFLPGFGNGPAPVTEFPGTFGAGDAGVDLSQAFLDVTWAKQINETTSLGIAGILAMQVFEAKGVSTFGGFTESFVQAALQGQQAMPTNLSNNGHEFSYGAGLKLGLHKKLSEETSLGIMYQSKIFMSELDDYADLFAEQGDFDIPANFKIGVTHMFKPNLAISFDIEHTWFSDVDSVGNSIMNLFSGCPSLNPMAGGTSGCLGGDNGGGFGWDDMTTYKIGAQWSNNEEWTWRAGFSWGDHPIPETEMTFNILAPAVMEKHFTFGFTKDTGNDREWNFAFMYAPNNAQTGRNNFDPTQSIKWEMDQFELELSYGWKF